MSIERTSRYNTRYRWDLNPRQREVLGLLATGMTNGEIGEALGLTLDGAKYHVSEILAKLGVSSRAEAAAYWRRYYSFGARVRRSVNAGAPAGFVAGALIVAVLLAAGIVLRMGTSDPAGSRSAGGTLAAAPTAATPAGGTVRGGAQEPGVDSLVVMRGGLLERYVNGQLVSKAAISVSGGVATVVEAADSPYAAGKFGCRTPGVYKLLPSGGGTSFYLMNDDSSLCPSRIDDLTSQVVAAQ